MKKRSHAEGLFERYLDGLGITFDFEPTVAGKVKRPDYRIGSVDSHIYIEVKEFERPTTSPRSGAVDPLPPIRTKIDKARTKSREFGDQPCVLVLHSCKWPTRWLGPEVVMSAAYGERFVDGRGVRTTLVDEPPSFRFFGSSTLRPNANKSISAIGILQHYELNENWVSDWYELYDRQEAGEILSGGAICSSPL